jgi:hypothetical protein
MERGWCGAEGFNPRNAGVMRNSIPLLPACIKGEMTRFR